MDNFINIVQTSAGEQVHFIDSRYYTKDHEKWYPGVTAILGVMGKGKAYEMWLKSNGFNADILAERAMSQGSRVHQAIQDLLEGKEVKFGTIGAPLFSRNEWVMISRFIDFYTEFKPKTGWKNDTRFWWSLNISKKCHMRRVAVLTALAKGKSKGE